MANVPSRDELLASGELLAMVDMIEKLFADDAAKARRVLLETLVGSIQAGAGRVVDSDGEEGDEDE